MNLSWQTRTGSTVEASEARTKPKIFAFKKPILLPYFGVGAQTRPNERDQNSQAIKMHKKKEKKERDKYSTPPSILQYSQKYQAVLRI